MNVICPMCERPLMQGDQLTAKWVDSHNWYVLVHTRDGVMWCGRANHQAVEELTLARRAVEQKGIEVYD